jgi:serine phosphatase RsbU (regulator of sigma subunit)
MSVVQNLLALYVGLVLFNVALAGALWRKNRDRLHRALFYVWATTLVSFVAQGALVQSDLAIVLGFTSVFAVNLSLAHLLALANDVALPWRRYVAVLAIGLALTLGGWLLGAGFTVLAAPVAIAVSLPAAVTAWRVLGTRWRRLTTSGRVLALGSLAFAAHNVDFAFLRDKPSFAPVGFTIAILVVFALSATGPAVVLELVTEREARIAAEMETARRIQTKILPRDTSLPGLDLVTFLRPAASVGGDYLDLYAFGDDCWLLLGDVTGHGLGAGLVMLMAQSTISSILHTKPGISPRELNFLANRILHRNLARLEEERHMTVVSLRRGPGNHFTISGSHDDILIVRAATGAVEHRAMAHFPMGLGFYDELAIDDVDEESFDLADGDLLFIGTDGVTEAAPGGDPRAGVLGERAVVELLTAHMHSPLEEIRAALIGRLDAHTRGVYHDDVAFLLVRAKRAPEA